MQGLYTRMINRSFVEEILQWEQCHVPLSGQLPLCGEPHLSGLEGVSGFRLEAKQEH